MTKLIGSVCLISAAFLMGLIKARSLRQHRDTLRELLSFLNTLNAEIVQNRSPYIRVLLRLKEAKFDNISEFISELYTSLSEESEQSFSESWSQAVEAKLKQLSDEERAELKALSQSLGRFDAELQSRAILRLSEQLSSKLSQEDGEMKEKQKLSLALSTGAGLILTITLI